LKLVLDNKAKAGGFINAKQYADACELNSYKYAKEHSEIAAEAVKKGQWGDKADLYGKHFGPGGPWETPDKYIAETIKSGHHSAFIKRYPSLWNPRK
jgi:hypothetical protein